MNSYRGLVFKYLKKEKKSTISIFISLIFAITLMTTMVFISQNFLVNSYEKIKINNGEYDVLLKNINSEKYEKIKGSNSITDYALTRTDGVLVTDEMYKANTLYGRLNYIEVYALEKKSFDEYFNIKVISGRLPEKENEVVLQKSVLDALGKNYSIGDLIEGDLRENRKASEYDLNMQYDENAEKIDIATEAFIAAKGEALKSKKVNYKVVGIVDTGRQNPVLNDKIITFLNDIPADNSNNSYKVLTRLKNKSGDKAIAEELGLKYIEKMPIMDSFGYEASDIGYPGYDSKNYVDIISNAKARNIVLVSIVFCFIALYNTFNSSTQKRIKYYGILRAVGANMKQIGFLVYMETLILYVLSIPIGILLGFGLNKLELIIIKRIMGTLNEYTVTLNMEAILITSLSVLLVTILTVYTALRKEAHMTPLEAINDSMGLSLSKKVKVKRRDKEGKVHEVYEDDGLNNKQLLDVLKYEKTTGLYKFIKKVFKFEGELAHKNINRNYKINKVTKATLIITMTLVIFFFMQIITGQFKADTTVKSDYWSVRITSNNTNFSDSDINKIKNIEGVTGVYTDKNLITPIIVEKNKMNSEFYDAMIFDNFGIPDKGSYKDKFGIVAKVRALDNDALNIYKNSLTNGSLNLDELDNGGIILVNKATNYYLKSLGSAGFLDVYADTDPTLKYNAGESFGLSLDPTLMSDSIQGKYITKSSVAKFEESNSNKINVTVVGNVVGDIFNNKEDNRNFSSIDSNVTLITSEKGFEKITGIVGKQSILVNTIKGNGRKETIEKINELAISNNYGVEDTIGKKELIEDNIREGISLNIMIAITAIALSLLNMINSSIANINSRTRELAACRAIGMSEVQERRMIIAEGLTISLSAGFITLVTTGIYSFASQGKYIGAGKMDPLVLIFGYLSIVIVMIIISNGTTLAALKQIKNISIVEALKEE